MCPSIRHNRTTYAEPPNQQSGRSLENQKNRRSPDNVIRKPETYRPTVAGSRDGQTRAEDADKPLEIPACRESCWPNPFWYFSLRLGTPLGPGPQERFQREEQTLTAPHPQQYDPMAAIIRMIGASFFFSLMIASAKYSAQHVPAAEVAFARVLINMLLLLPLAKILSVDLRGSRRKLLLTRSIFGSASLVLNFFGAAHLRVGDQSMLMRTSVPFTALFSVLLLRERVSRRILVLITVAFIGAALIVKPSIEFLNLPGIATLASAALVAAVAVTIRELHQTEHTLTIVFYFTAGGTIFIGLIFGTTFVLPTLPVLYALIAVGLCGSCAQILFTQAFRSAPASIVMPFAYSEGLFALLWGYLWWREVLDIWSLIGAALLVGSGLGILLSESPPRHSTALEQESV